MVTPTPTASEGFFDLPVWSFLGSMSGYIIGFISLCWWGYHAIRSHKKKDITYSILTDTYLADFSADLPIPHKIQILVNDKQVKRVRHVVLRIENKGNIDIENDDIEYPITFLPSGLLADGKLLGAYVSNAHPSNPLAFLSDFSDIGMVGLNRFTMHAGTKIEISILLADYTEPIIPQTHIKGIKEMRNVNPYASEPLGFLYGSTICIIFSIIIAAVLSAPLTIIIKANYLYTFAVIAGTLILGAFLIYLFIKARKLLGK